VRLFRQLRDSAQGGVGFDIIDIKTLRQELQKHGFKRLQRRRVLRAAR
jgi:hypothetical protein